ncbi:MAG: cytochrome c3 family protein [Thermoanaerobaculales bacterium]|nr:cytochrome c3 family protein [Thermoanaerobaculales bacterium]
MSRTKMKSLVFLLAFGGVVTSFAASPNPHVDKGLNSGGCRSCHEGHGVSGSPMLPTGQRDLCLQCHGSPGQLQAMVARGLVSGNARPVQMDGVLGFASVHPISEKAFSRRQQGVVTCTSCHAAHKGSAQAPSQDEPSGQRRVSPRDATEFEFSLCQGCHGSGGAGTQDLLDISRLLTPENRSFHPVEAPAADGSPSVIPSLSGREINCTDCHGNANRGGPKGPHGSPVPFLLRANYTTADGSSESPTVYALCYRCHRREMVLKQSPFPEHQAHIDKERASCATCHNPHGSVGSRALIRFGEETTVAGVSASMSTGRLEFVSDGPGSGACYLTCHGEDHGPEAYGSMKSLLEMLGREGLRRDQRFEPARIAPTRGMDLD